MSYYLATMKHEKRNKQKAASMSQWKVLIVQRYANLLLFTSYVFLAKLINKNDSDLYKDEGLLIL